jgi:hypothetical protein
VSTPALPEIAFDEAGNTGADLLNSEQPVFSLASISLGYTEADQLLSTIRTHQTRELKFSRLRRSESGRRRLKELLASPALSPENVVLSLFHKRFMAIAKIVDLLIEPLAHRDGIDFYQQGLNLAYSNLLHICLPVYFGSESVDRLLAAFVDMFRLRTPESVNAFYDFARDLFQKYSSKEIAGPFAPIVASENLIDEVLARCDKLSLDPAIPGFFQQCALWGERFGGPFKLVHDESKPVFQDREVLESFMAPEEEGQRIGYGRRTILFPLRAQGIRFARSQDDPLHRTTTAQYAAAAGELPGRCAGNNPEPLGRLVVDGSWRYYDARGSD